MTRQPTGPDAGADDGDPSVAAAGRNNGQLTRSMILQTALASSTATGWTDCPCAASATHWAAIR